MGGDLGVGHTNNIGDDVNEMGDYLAITDVGGAPISLHGGGRHTCAVLTSSGTLFELFQIGGWSKFMWTRLLILHSTHCAVNMIQILNVGDGMTMDRYIYIYIQYMYIYVELEYDRNPMCSARIW